MTDILMIASPPRLSGRVGPFKTLWLSSPDFWRDEAIVKDHDRVLWQAFHTHGKHQRIVQLVSWFCVAVDAKGRYVSSACVIEAGSKWLLEYLMTDPTKQSRGAGSAVMHRIMKEAKKRRIQWVILNCDPQKNQGQLPRFYSTFGFERVA